MCAFGHKVNQNSVTMPGLKQGPTMASEAISEHQNFYGGACHQTPLDYFCMLTPHTGLPVSLTNTILLQLGLFQVSMCLIIPVTGDNEQTALTVFTLTTSTKFNSKNE